MRAFINLDFLIVMMQYLYQVHVDDGWIVSNNDELIDTFIKDIKKYIKQIK